MGDWKWSSRCEGAGCRLLIASFSAALSASLFYFSTGLGDLWPLAWFAPAPLLWLAYGRCTAWIAAAAAFVAFVIGQLGFLEAFAGLRIATIMTMAAIVFSAILFTAAILFARIARRRLHPILAIVAFPAAWTSVEYLISLFSPNGTVGALAYTQAGAPVLIQCASLFGIWLVTFLLCLIASCVALAIQEPRHAALAAGIGLTAFAANAAFGILRLHQLQVDPVRIAVAAKDLPERGSPRSFETWMRLTMDYGDLARKLASRGATTVVLPEKLAVLRPAWREAVLAPLARASREANVRIVAGFDDDGAVEHNIAVIFWPSGAVSNYIKRRLIPGLDRNVEPGVRSGFLGAGSAVAICKDMDYPALIRGDAQQHIRLMLVPAEDFFVDHWMHERIAILRGVEDGFSVARAARKGDIMVTDDRGRVLALAGSSTNMESRVVDVPLGSGDTLYLKIGDIFAWVCLVTTLLLFWLICANIGRRHAGEDRGLP